MQYKMNQAYVEIVKVINEDCVHQDSKYTRSNHESKLHQILRILTEHGYVDESHIIFPEFTS
jgi:hypothetical protein